jgi:hypothetical protein
MPSFAYLTMRIETAWTLGALRSFLDCAGFTGRGVDTCVLCAPAEFVIAAAIARETTGA